MKDRKALIKQTKGELRLSELRVTKGKERTKVHNEQMNEQTKQITCSWRNWDPGAGSNPSKVTLVLIRNNLTTQTINSLWAPTTYQKFSQSFFPIVTNHPARYTQQPEWRSLLSGVASIKLVKISKDNHSKTLENVKRIYNWQNHLFKIYRTQS